VGSGGRRAAVSPVAPPCTGQMLGRCGVGGGCRRGRTCWHACSAGCSRQTSGWRRSAPGRSPLCLRRIVLRTQLSPPITAAPRGAGGQARGSWHRCTQPGCPRAARRQQARGSPRTRSLRARYWLDHGAFNKACRANGWPGCRACAWCPCCSTTRQLPTLRSLSPARRPPGHLRLSIAALSSLHACWSQWLPSLAPRSPGACACPGAQPCALRCAVLPSAAVPCSASGLIRSSSL